MLKVKILLALASWLAILAWYCEPARVTISGNDIVPVLAAAPREKRPDLYKSIDQTVTGSIPSTGTFSTATTTNATTTTPWPSSCLQTSPNSMTCSYNNWGR